MYARTVAGLMLASACLGHAARAQTRPHAQDGEASVAAKLQNPIADLVTVPLQNNMELGIGPKNGTGYTLNLQPVIPIPLGPDMTIVSRTILPALIVQPPLFAGTGSTAGVGDLTQSFFFSPRGGALIWGVGPVLLLPTATSDLLGAGKWGIGPTAVALVQRRGWTAGVLANHIWSFAGDEAQRQVSRTFIQPFLSYTFPQQLSVTLQSETVCDWQAQQWTVPLAAGVAQVFLLGRLPVSVGLFVRYWVEKPITAPDWGIRVPITFVLPGFES